MLFRSTEDVVLRALQNCNAHVIVRSAISIPVIHIICEIRYNLKRVMKTPIFRANIFVAIDASFAPDVQRDSQAQDSNQILIQPEGHKSSLQN